MFWAAYFSERFQSGADNFEQMYKKRCFRLKMPEE